jgi:hypothetical protein
MCFLLPPGQRGTHLILPGNCHGWSRRPEQTFLQPSPQAGCGPSATIPLPALPYPGKLVVHPDPKTEESAPNVVLPAHVGVVQVTNAIVLIKADQKPSVTHWNVSRHENTLPRNISADAQTGQSAES